MENFRFSAVAKAWEHKPVEVKPMNVSVPTFFGRQVFTRERMRDYIAEQTLEQLFDAIDKGNMGGSGSIARVVGRVRGKDLELVLDNNKRSKSRAGINLTF